MNSKIAALLLLSPVTYALIRSDKRSMEDAFYSFGQSQLSNENLEPKKNAYANDFHESRPTRSKS